MAHVSNASSIRVMAFVLIAGSAACGPDAVFRVVHPAALPTADYGNAYSLGDFSGVSGQAAATYRQLVMQSIQRSINPAIRLAQGQGLVVSATVDADSFESSQRREDDVCRCAYSNGTDPQGRRQYIYQNTPCIAYVTEAVGSSVVTFRVTDANTGSAVFAQSYSSGNRWTARALSAPNCEAVPPNDQFRNFNAPPIGRQVIGELYQRNMASFARVILPWAEDVEVDLESCDRDPRCSQAEDLLGAGNFEAALGLYDQVLAPYEDVAVQIPADELEKVSEALYNRGTVRGYTSDYLRAQIDLERACALNPTEASWQQQLQRIQELAREQEELTRQSGMVQ